MSTFIITAKEYWTPYKSCVKGLIKALYTLDEPLFNSSFNKLSKIKLVDNYEFGLYKYINRNPFDKYNNNEALNYVYVHQQGANDVYSPLIKQSWKRRFLGINDGKLFFERTDYIDSMKIIHPLYMHMSIKSIPPTIKYICVPFSHDSIWQYYLYYLCLNYQLGSIFFSYDEILKHLNVQKSMADYEIDDEEYKHLVSKDTIPPKIIIEGEYATINAVIQTKSDLYLRTDIFKQIENNKLENVHCECTKLSLIKKKESPLGLADVRIDIVEDEENLDNFYPSLPFEIRRQMKKYGF